MPTTETVTAREAIEAALVLNDPLNIGNASMAELVALVREARQAGLMA